MNAELNRRNFDFESRHGHVRPPTAALVGDKWLMAIGSRIYKQTQDGPYNFVNALHDHAVHFFGDELLDLEEGKPLADRLPPLIWLEAFVENNKSDRTVNVGAGAAWIRFAYDLYTIRDNSHIENRLRQRLLSRIDFQGARHELRISALCIAAGFDIFYENEADNTRKHPEFIAVDKISGQRIAVEAKSRHRRGVYGFVSGKDEPWGASVGVRSLVVDAYGHELEMPLYVFVDVNLPPFESEQHRESWNQEISLLMSDLTREGYSDPCPANTVFFLNDPSHYMLNEPIGKHTDCLWIQQFTADTPRVPNPIDVVDRFLDAHRFRAYPPADFAG
jgi:hypothetical protein